MEKQQEILNFLGLARRAGKVSLGFDAAAEAVTKHKAKLIIIASDISERTRGAVLKNAETANVKVIVSAIPMENLGTAVGKLTGIVSVNDEGFVRKLQKLFGE